MGGLARIFLSRRAVLVLFVFLCSTSAHSASTSWTNPAGGSWDDPSNWSGGVLPGSAEAHFNLDASYTVNVPTANTSAAALVASAGTVTLNIAQDFGTNQLSIEGSPGAPAHVTFKGRTMGYGAADVGCSTTTLNGTVIRSDGKLVFDQTLAFGSWFLVGQTGGKGEMQIKGGAQVRANSGITVGAFATTSGGIIYPGEGTFTLSGGARIDMLNETRIGYSGGIGSVTVDAATLNAGSTVIVGLAGDTTHPGRGTLLGSNGASIASWRAYVGCANGHGTVSLSGANTDWSLTGYMFIGNSRGELGNDDGGFGTVSISNNARLSVFGGVAVDADSHLILSSGATLETAGILLNGVASRFTWTGGTLKINVNAPAADGLLTVPNTGTLGGVGNIERPILVSPGGTLAPGNGVGSISTAALTLSADSNYFVEIDPDANKADKTKVTGVVDLTGATLTFDLLTKSPLIAPDTFILIDNDSTDPIVGIFSGLLENTTYVRGEAEFTVSYHAGDGNDVAITFTQVPEPDSAIALLAAAALWLQRRRGRIGALALQ